MSSPRASRSRSCALLGCGLPTVCAILIIGIYFRNNRSIDIPIPSHQVPANNGRDDFVQAGKMALSMKHRSPISRIGMPGYVETLQSYADCAKEAEPIIQRMHQGLTKPCVCPPCRSGDYEHYGKELRDLARLISGVAIYEELKGNLSRAIDLRLDGIAMASYNSNGGTLLDAMIGHAISAMMEERLDRLIPRLNREQLDHVLSRLAEIRRRRTLVADMIREDGYAELALCLESLRDRLHHGISGQIKLAKEQIRLEKSSHAASFQQMLDEISDVDKPLRWDEGWDVASFVVGNKSGMLDDVRCYYVNVEAEARRPYIGKSNVKVPRSLFISPDGLTDIRKEVLGDDAAFDLLRLSAAVFRYRAEHSRFPAILDDLVPSILPSLPPDPFGGPTLPPFRYRVKPGGRAFLLYSVGSDMKDDGGMPKRTPLMDAPGDIVAGQLWQGKQPAILNRRISPGPMPRTG